MQYFCGLQAIVLGNAPLMLRWSKDNILNCLTHNIMLLIKVKVFRFGVPVEEISDPSELLRFFYCVFLTVMISSLETQLAV